MSKDMIEIERKFLVDSVEFKAEASKKFKIAQGYLNRDPERSVRIRTKGEKAFLTVKGAGKSGGMTRFEWEKEIDLQDAEALLKLCEPGIITKTRFLVPSGKHTFEVDEFFGENEGLVMAEVELSSEEETFSKPDWLGEEVTGKTAYYNAALSKNPFKNWKKPK